MAGLRVSFLTSSPWGDSKEAGGIDGVAPFDGGVDQVVDCGTDRAPKLAELRTVGWTSRLGGHIGVSARQRHTGVLLQARAARARTV